MVKSWFDYPYVTTKEINRTINLVGISIYLVSNEYLPSRYRVLGVGGLQHENSLGR